MISMRLGALLERAPSGPAANRNGMPLVGRPELLKRDSTAPAGNHNGSSKTKAIVIAVCVVAAVLFALVFFFVVRNLRRRKVAEPRRRKTSTRRRPWLQRLRSTFATPTDANTPLSTVEVQTAPRDPDAAVDRHISIRSIATLPAYSAVPLDGEGIIAREGDREGMDTVVEFPETAEEEEERREEEMESLFRIRQQRREEAAEREERRRRRREARARGDTATLNALRRESVLRSTARQNNGSAAMIAQYHSRTPREPRVGAVSYGDLGVARHDGSRVRANSTESDNAPLLDGAAAAGMGGAPVRPWLSRETLSSHQRMDSGTSTLSRSSFDSEERPGVDREGSDFEVISLQETRSRAHSSARPPDSLSLRRPSTQVTTLDADLGESRIPHPEPPHYDSMGFEEAPPYEDLHSESRDPSRSLDQDRESPSSSPSSEHHADTPPSPRASEHDREPPSPSHSLEHDREAPSSIPTSSDRQTEASSPPPQLPAIDRLPSIRISESSPIDSPRRLGSLRGNIPSIIHEETN